MVSLVVETSLAAGVAETLTRRTPEDDVDILVVDFSGQTVAEVVGDRGRRVVGLEGRQRVVGDIDAVVNLDTGRFEPHAKTSGPTEQIDGVHVVCGVTDARI